MINLIKMWHVARSMIKSISLLISIKIIKNTNEQFLKVMLMRPPDELP